MSRPDPEMVDTLLLVRLLASRPSERVLKDCLREISAAEPLEDCLARLRASEMLRQSGLELTASGTARALGWLGLSAKPRGLTWRTVKSRYIPARCLGIPSDALGADELRAHLVMRAHGLQVRGKVTYAKVVSALTWKALGVTSDEPASLGKVRGALFNRLLPAPVKGDWESAFAQIAQMSAGASTTSTNHLHAALLTRMLTSTDGDFSDRVKCLARQPGVARFGEKVFVASVWSAYVTRDSALTLDAFKVRLLDAHRKGQLVLSRADLQYVMDEELVARSRIADGRSEYHFINLEG